MYTVSKCFAIAALVLATGTPLLAQNSGHIGIGGGVTIPVGTLDTTQVRGAQAIVMVITPPIADLPFAFRFDYSYNGFGAKSTSTSIGSTTNINAVTGDLVVQVGAGAIKPYILGGIGRYTYHQKPSDPQRSAWGANGGAGVLFPIGPSRLNGFIEARYHFVPETNKVLMHFVPLSAGLMF